MRRVAARSHVRQGMAKMESRSSPARPGSKWRAAPATASRPTYGHSVGKAIGAPCSRPTPLKSLWNEPDRARWIGGGYDDPGVHSVLVHAGNSQQLTVGVSCDVVWRSEDGCATWRAIGEGLRAAYLLPIVAVAWG